MTTKKIELIILGMSLIITALIGWSQVRLGQIQSDFAINQSNRESARQVEQARNDSLRNIDNIELQLINFSKDFFPDIKKENDEGEIARNIILATMEHLTDEFGRNTLAKIVDRVNQEQVKDFSNESVNLFEVRTKEATKNTTNNEWFTVIASFNIKQMDRAKTFSNNEQNRINQLGKSYKTHIWKTKTSKVIAITIDKTLSKEDAIKRMNFARKEGISEEAFIQKNKDWVYVE